MLLICNVRVISCAFVDKIKDTFTSNPIEIIFAPIDSSLNSDKEVSLIFVCYYFLWYLEKRRLMVGGVSGRLS